MFGAPCFGAPRRYRSVDQRGRGVTCMGSRRPRIVGLSCACVLLITMFTGLSTSASAATPRRASQSREQVILLLIHPSDALTSFVKAVSDPSSLQYRQFLPIGQLERRFGASAATK